jgi:4-hydroxy-2-oxoheptanedioate aldolase
MERVNKLRKILKDGGTAIGTCLDSFSPGVAEVAGYSGLDFVRIDTEYSWRRDESLENMIRACAVSGTSPLVRVEKGQPYLISKAFQAGADAILVCDVNGYDEARDIVRAARFAPKGVRGYNTFTPGGRWGFDGGKAWVDWCDSELMVGIMVENQEVLAELDKVMAIDGLDYCFFGPSDFSMSLGFREPRKNDPKVQDAMKRTCEIAARHGKWVCLPLAEPFAKEAKHYGDMGFRMMELGHDMSVLSSVWKRSLAEIKGK